MEILLTQAGTIEYEFARKRVKNLNVRIRPDSTVVVSAPLRMPKREIERFLHTKAQWILTNQQRIAQKPPLQPCHYTKAECLALFESISNEIFPLFASVLSGRKPLLKVREMKSRWGVCHVQKRSITLNQRLAEKPRPVIEYVIMHEYVHFIHPNHQAGFHAEMARLMPDYKQRRQLL